MMASHYAPAHSAHYGYAPPPSPPMDESSKCSLPSISNLLGLADQGSPSSETFPASQRCKRQSRSGSRERNGNANVRTAQSAKAETRPNSSHTAGSVMARAALPPSPPMSSDASFDGYNSPSTKSVSQLPSASNYYFETTPPLGHMEAEARHMVPRVSVPAPAYPTQYAAPAYMSQPQVASYYPPMQPTPPPQAGISGLYFQRPLPQVRVNRFTALSKRYILT
jgi:hypothetical protein